MTISVTQDLVIQSNSTPPAGQMPISGLSFQLNCYSPQRLTSSWQQYVIYLSSGKLIGKVNNWKSLDAFLINRDVNLTTVSNNRIVAGDKLTIALQNDGEGNVTGVRFTVVNGTGATLASQTVSLTSIPGVTAADLAPIVAFELNLVGPANSEQVILSSGAGTITYASSTTLNALASEPLCAFSGIVTAETSNVTHGAMIASPGINLVQTFGVSASMPVPKSGKLRPPLRL